MENTEKFWSLKVWKKAHDLVLDTYKITNKFPSSERFILLPQMIRAAISVAANIVEGSRRGSPKDRAHFHNIADTSLEELKYYFVLAKDLQYITESEYTDLMEKAREIGKMLTSLTRKL